MGGKKGAAGGLVGANAGYIDTCVAQVSVSVEHAKGVALIGGLAGGNFVSITGSYATGSVSGRNTNMVGGLVGFDYGGGRPEFLCNRCGDGRNGQRSRGPYWRYEKVKNRILLFHRRGLRRNVEFCGRFRWRKPGEYNNFGQLLGYDDQRHKSGRWQGWHEGHHRFDDAATPIRIAVGI